MKGFFHWDWLTSDECCNPIQSRWLVGWLCFTSHRQRGHLETAPPFTVPCKGREAQLIHRTHRESNPGLWHGKQKMHGRYAEYELYLKYVAFLNFAEIRVFEKLFACCYLPIIKQHYNMYVFFLLINWLLLFVNTFTICFRAANLGMLKRVLDGFKKSISPSKRVLSFIAIIYLLFT